MRQQLVIFSLFLLFIERIRLQFVPVSPFAYFATHKPSAENSTFGSRPRDVAVQIVFGVVQVRVNNQRCRLVGSSDGDLRQSQFQVHATAVMLCLFAFVAAIRHPAPNALGMGRKSPYQEIKNPGFTGVYEGVQFLTPLH